MFLVALIITLLYSIWQFDIVDWLSCFYFSWKMSRVCVQSFIGDNQENKNRIETLLKPLLPALVISIELECFG